MCMETLLSNLLLLFVIRKCVRSKDSWSPQRNMTSFSLPQSWWFPSHPVYLLLLPSTAISSRHPCPSSWIASLPDSFSQRSSLYKGWYGLLLTPRLSRRTQIFSSFSVPISPWLMQVYSKQAEGYLDGGALSINLVNSLGKRHSTNMH